jgi:hypothetical protein
MTSPTVAPVRVGIEEHAPPRDPGPTPEPCQHVGLCDDAHERPMLHHPVGPDSCAEHQPDGFVDEGVRVGSDWGLAS